MNIGDTVVLKGKSQKGKQRIKQYGSEWIIIGKQSGSILVSSVTDNSNIHLPDSARWIDLPEDRDLIIQQEKSMTLEQAQQLVAKIKKQLLHGQATEKDLENAERIRDHLLKK